MASQLEAAAHIFVTPRTFRRLLEEHIIERQKGGVYDLDVVRKSYLENLRERAGGRAGKSGGLDLASERAALARRQREHLELLTAIKRRDHVPGIEAARQTGLAGEILLEHFRTLGVLAAPDLVGLVDVPAAAQPALTAAMQAVVDGRMNAAMAEFQRMNESGEFARMLAPVKPVKEEPK